MPEPLNHIRQKLYRADEHILQVQNGVDSIIASIPDRVVPKDDVDAVRRLRNTLALISIPEPLQIVAGEAIHQTRSALDHFAAQLAGTKWSDKTEFPIQVHRPVKPDEIGRFERKIEGFPLVAATIIKDLQPYKLPESRREDYWLTILKRLNNRDKPEPFSRRPSLPNLNSKS